MHRRLVFAFFVIFLMSGTVEPCGTKIPTQENNGSPSSNPSAINKMLVDNVKITPYESSGYDDKSGQAEKPDDLACDFSRPCCWKNTKPPYDTMEWASASGQPDATKFEKFFGTSTVPTGNYLMTESDNAAGVADKAEFQSCLVKCSADDVKVTVSHWTSEGGPKIQICQVFESDPDSSVNCQDLPSNGPGPDTATLPGGQNFYITITAYNMVSSDGNIAIIKDINVDFNPCSSSTADAPTTAAGPNWAECPKVACNFNDGMCGYAKGNFGSNVFQQAGPEPFKNRITGVWQSPDQSKFAASYLKPGEKSSMEVSSDLFADSDRQVKFQEYKATQGITTKACCDSTDNCPYETGSLVHKENFRQWYQGGLICKKGTKKLIFVADNLNSNEGGVGIDNIQVFDVSGAQQIC